MALLPAAASSPPAVAKPGASVPIEAAPTPTAFIATPRATDSETRILAAPVSERHIFKVFYGNLSNRVPVAKLEYTVRHDGVMYEIRTRAQAEGLAAIVYSGVLTQSSTGRVGPKGLEPLQYVEQRGKRPQRTLSFDREQGVVTNPDRELTIPMPPGTQDRLSVLYQLALLVRSDPKRFVAGSSHVLSVASMSRVAQEQFDVIGPAIVSPTDRPIRALHISRLAAEGSDDPKIDVWLGYDFGMMPVRLRVQDANGRVLDQLIAQGS